MACYSDKVKAIAAKVVGAISVIIVIVGIISVILGAIQMGAVQKPNSWSGIDAFDQSGLGIGILVLGAIAILIGLCGFLTCKCKKPWFTVPFMLLTFVIGVIILIIGLVILGAAAGLVDDLQAKLCQSISQSANGSQLSYKYNQAVQNFVCSQTCPCPAGDNNEIEKLWTTMDEATFNEWNRTKKSTAEAAKGYAPLIFSKNATGSYASWRDCYDKVLVSQATATATNENLKAVAAFVKDGGLDFLADSESKLKCAGVCKTALFYVTLPVS